MQRREYQRTDGALLQTNETESIFLFYFELHHPNFTMGTLRILFSSTNSLRTQAWWSLAPALAQTSRQIVLLTLDVSKTPTGLTPSEDCVQDARIPCDCKQVKNVFEKDFMFIAILLICYHLWWCCRHEVYSKLDQ